MNLEETTVKIEEDWSMDDVIQYVKTWATYEQQIKDIRESRNEWSKEFLEEKSIPKKELAQAMQIVKKNLDAGVINEIIDTISGMLSE